MPVTLWLSWLCEEFGALPSQILREVAAAPDGLLEDIAQVRNYVRAYYTGEAKDRPKGQEPPPSEMERLVREIEADLAREEMDADRGRIDR